MTDPVNETRETRVKRLKMRSMRRGIKEMDLILSAYSQSHLDGLSDADLVTYDALLSENDHDIYGWITGQAEIPDHYAAIMVDVVAGAKGLTRPV